MILRFQPSFFLIGFAVLILAGCTSGRRPTESYVSHSGTVTSIESDRESCERSCNADYARCGDMLSTIRSDVGSDPSIGTFGVRSDCQAQLRNCLPRCKGR